MSQLKRKLEQDETEMPENKRQKSDNYSSVLNPLPNELLIHIMKSGSLQDQTLVVALFAMVSTQARNTALYVREKYGIPPLAACNVKILTDSKKYLLSIPRYLLTDEELFLLKCAAKSIFYRYLDYRESSLAYAVSGWIYHKYEKFCLKRGKKLKRIDYKLYTEIMAGGISEDDPSIKIVEKTYFWCVLREKELKSRGWTWEAKKWNGYASCCLDDTKDSKDLMKERKLKNLPPLFFTLDVDEDELEDEGAEENGDQEDDNSQDRLEDEDDEKDEESDKDEHDELDVSGSQ